MAEQIKVIVQNPPGGRCTLYMRYTILLESLLGLQHSIVLSERRQAHGEGYPSMVLCGRVLMPADGIMLTPEDIHAALLAAGIDLHGTPDMLERLEVVHAAFLEELESGKPL
ncbi:MAG TPA: hypothetical protein VFR06_04665 [Gallionellaceae bacterium]|nr:hypothetical protein [Gallionellaceae bacterium]